MEDKPYNYASVSRAIRRYQKHFDLDPWIPRDLRHTVSTQMGNLGIAPYVVEKILNHTMQGVMAVRNHSEYLLEKIEAMTLWSEKIRQIINSDQSVVVALKRTVSWLRVPAFQAKCLKSQ